ncbi:hypothetical protein EDD86DRAFT_196474 [Gorgonomyces haynaldii]|nr:hypothetical protein EDD86DRAFT_196474 [Gorgonomyces haynaldii]
MTNLYETPTITDQKGNKRYRCREPTCTQTFSTSGHLSRHMKIHTGEKTHCCPIQGCESKFARRDNMMQHFTAHKKKLMAKNQPVLLSDEPKVKKTSWSHEERATAETIKPANLTHFTPPSSVDREYSFENGFRPQGQFVGLSEESALPQLDDLQRTEYGRLDEPFISRMPDKSFSGRVPNDFSIAIPGRMNAQFHEFTPESPFPRTVEESTFVPFPEKDQRQSRRVSASKQSYLPSMDERQFQMRPTPIMTQSFQNMQFVEDRYLSPGYNVTSPSFIPSPPNYDKQFSYVTSSTLTSIPASFELRTEVGYFSSFQTSMNSKDGFGDEPRITEL